MVLFVCFGFCLIWCLGCFGWFVCGCLCFLLLFGFAVCFEFCLDLVFVLIGFGFWVYCGLAILVLIIGVLFCFSCFDLFA